MKKVVLHISGELHQRVSDRANKMGCSVESVLVGTLNEAFDQMERQEYAASFQRASADPELMEMAEMGMSDYEDQLRGYNC